MEFPSKEKFFAEKLVEFQFRVPSRSEKGTYRTVTAWKDGTMTCDCPLNSLGFRICRHIKTVDAYIAEHGIPNQQKNGNQTNQ